MRVFDSIFTIALDEGLITTQDAQKTSNIIEKKFNDVETDYGEDEDYIKVKFLTHTTDKSKLDSLLVLINNLGWFPSAYYYNNGYSYRFIKYNYDQLLKHLIRANRIILIIEKKFDTEYKKQNIFYHATKQKYSPKIEKIGLTPRTQSKIGYHPERIYLAINFNAALEILDLLYDADNKDELEDSYWVIYEVDATKIPNLKTMKDPNFDGGVYTTQNIPPTALKVIKKFDMSK